MVITGDITQVDLPNGKASGLIQIQHILHNIDGIDFVYFRNVMSFVIRSCKKLSKHTIATSYISRMLISRYVTAPVITGGHFICRLLYKTVSVLLPFIRQRSSAMYNGP